MFRFHKDSNFLRRGQVILEKTNIGLFDKPTIDCDENPDLRFPARTFFLYLHKRQNDMAQVDLDMCANYNAGLFAEKSEDVMFFFCL